jgi:hypothetical protein
VALKQRGAVVNLNFRVERGSPVRLLVLTPQQARRLTRGRPYTALAATGYAQSARLRRLLAEPGNYVVAIENREQDRGASRVRVALWLDFAGARPRHADPMRGLLSVVLSLAFFAGVAVYTGVRLRAALEHREI